MDIAMKNIYLVFEFSDEIGCYPIMAFTSKRVAKLSRNEFRRLAKQDRVPHSYHYTELELMDTDINDTSQD